MAGLPLLWILTALLCMIIAHNQAFHLAFTVIFVPSCPSPFLSHTVFYFSTLISVCVFHLRASGHILPSQPWVFQPLLSWCPTLTAPSPFFILFSESYWSSAIKTNTRSIAFAPSMHSTRYHYIYRNFSVVMSTPELLSIFPLNIDLIPVRIQIIIISTGMSVRSVYKKSLG